MNKLVELGDFSKETKNVTPGAGDQPGPGEP